MVPFPRRLGVPLYDQIRFPVPVHCPFPFSMMVWAEIHGKPLFFAGRPVWSAEYMVLLNSRPVDTVLIKEHTQKASSVFLLQDASGMPDPFFLSGGLREE